MPTRNPRGRNAVVRRALLVIAISVIAAATAWAQYEFRDACNDWIGLALAVLALIGIIGGIGVAWANIDNRERNNAKCILDLQALADKHEDRLDTLEREVLVPVRGVQEDMRAVRAALETLAARKD